VIANLWDVTDKDIDAFSEQFLKYIGVMGEDSKDSVTATLISRKACKLRYLNGAAPVVYGIPLSIDNK
jgi:separase